jgi:hypothetical protein
MPGPGGDGLQVGAQHPLVVLAPARARLRGANGSEIEVEGNGDVRDADFMLPLAALYAPRLAVNFAPSDRVDLGAHVSWLNAGAQARFFDSVAHLPGRRLALSLGYQIGYPVPRAATVIPTPHEGRLLFESHPPLADRWASWFAIGSSFGNRRHSLRAADDIIDIGRNELRFELAAGLQFRTASRRTALLLAVAPYLVAQNGRGSGEPRQPGGYEVIQYRQRWGLAITLSWLAGLQRPTESPGPGSRR